MFPLCYNIVTMIMNFHCYNKCDNDWFEKIGAVVMTALFLCSFLSLGE